MQQRAQRYWLPICAMIAAAGVVHSQVLVADDSNQPVQTDLFEAGSEGYRLYRIPGIVVTKKGTVLAYCEARKGDGDWGPIDVMMRRSTDGKNHFRTSLLTVARVTEDWVRDGGEADKAENLPGIVMDDDEAEYQGDWAESSNLPALVGSTYHHDGNKGRGEKSATFTATIPETGDYEIRLLYTWSENRSTRTTVTVTGAGEEKTLRINQRDPAMKDRVPNALGIFRFEAGATAGVTVSNEGADGYVIVDALQILPAELAREERAGKRPSGYAAIEMVKRVAPAPVANPPVVNVPRKPLKPDPPRAAAPADVHGKTYRSLLPKGLDNLLVPICLSSTHVAWGTIRLETTWMNVAESAAYAADLALETGVSPSDIDSDALLRRLAEGRVMITFFNDLDLGDDDPRVPAAQYFGTKGFFSSYDANLDEPLTEGVRSVWEAGLQQLRDDTLEPMRLAERVHRAELQASPDTGQTRGGFLLAQFSRIKQPR